MKTKNFAKKALVMVAMTLMFVMNAQAQQKRVMEFQVLMAMNETTYKNCLKQGKYKEAITSLTTLINILDTTTIHKDTEISENLIKESKGLYQYDMACCYALVGQKKQALQALEKSVLRAVFAHLHRLTTIHSCEVDRTRPIAGCINSTALIQEIAHISLQVDINGTYLSLLGTACGSRC